MNKKIELVYVFDAYCGWCYGFDIGMREFYAKHDDIKLEIISGGLFVDDEIKYVDEEMKKYMVGANEKIESIYGIRMGEKYKEKLNSESLVLNSRHPASVFAHVKKFIKNYEQLEFAADLQKRYFEDGVSLSEIEAYEPLILKYGLQDKISNEEIKELIENGGDEAIDFKHALDLRVEIFPTLFVKIDDKIIDLHGHTKSADELEITFQRILDDIEK